MAIDETLLIDTFLNNYLVKNDGTWNDAIDRAVELTKAQPKVNEWIPVSEKLPEPEQEVLLQLENSMVVGFYYVEGGHYDGTTNWYANSDNYEYTDCDSKPIAWLPLPETYKEGLK